jgi:hypothetical protein
MVKMIEITELKVEMKKFDAVTHWGSFPSVRAEVIPTVTILRAATDRLLVSYEGVRVLGVGR